MKKCHFLGLNFLPSKYLLSMYYGPTLHQHLGSWWWTHRHGPALRSMLYIYKACTMDIFNPCTCPLPMRKQASWRDTRRVWWGGQALESTWSPLCPQQPLLIRSFWLPLCFNILICEMGITPVLSQEVVKRNKRVDTFKIPSTELGISETLKKY